MTMRLLFIDEEVPVIDIALDQRDLTPYMWYYENALRESEHPYTVVRTVDEAVALLRTDPSKFDVVSIDIIMPTGDIFADEDTSNGTMTGITLLKWIVSQRLSVSVIVLSNVPPRIINAALPTDLGGVKRLEVLEKKKTSPFQFLKVLDAIRGKK